MTKRQLLNALLDANEVQAKIDASQKRLWSRGEKLNDVREDLAHELFNILWEEEKKSGINVTSEPIVFKNHMFAVTERRRYDRATCTIKAIKNVK